MILDKQSAIGGIIPNARISKITLESGDASSQIKRYPHIDHPSETSKYFEDSTEDQMKVTLNIVIKDTVGKKGFSSWRENFDFEQYFKIGVVQSTDNGTVGTDFIYGGYKGNNFLERVATALAADHGEMAQSDIQVLPVYDPVTEDSETPTKKYKFVDDAGQVYYEFQKNVKFDVESSKPNHLSYFVFSFIDLGALENDFPDLDTEVFDQVEVPGTDGVKASNKFMGDIELACVFSNSSVNRVGKIYVTEDNEIWTGAVHTMPGGRIMTGLNHTTDSKNLSSKVVPNPKIQDFRARKKMYDFIADLNYDSAKFYAPKNAIKIVAAEDNAKKDVGAHFSDLMIARDYKGRARMLFSVNYEEILRERGKFGAVLANQSTLYNPYQEVINNSDIVSLKVIRRQVFDGKPRPDEIEHVIVEGNTNDAGEFKSIPDSWGGHGVEAVTTTTGIVHEAPGPPGAGGGSQLPYEGNIRIASNNLHVGPHGAKLKSFDVTDYGVQYKGAGTYQYGVEMEVSDGTYLYVKGLLGGLQAARTTLKAYYAASLVPGVFDAQANKFTQYFQNSWVFMKQTLANSLPIFFKAYVAVATKYFDHTELATNLAKYASPSTGSPDGISILLNLFDELATTYEKLTGIKTVPKSGIGAAPADAVGASAPQQRMIKIKYYFPTQFQSIDGAFGYDFLATSEHGYTHENTQASGVGLREYSSQQYINRVKKETKKLFAADTGDITISSVATPNVAQDSLETTKYDYLTANYVFTGAPKAKDLRTPGPANPLLVDIVTKVTDFEPPNLAIKDEKVRLKNTLIKVLASQGCTVASENIVTDLNYSFDANFVQQLAESENPTLGDVLESYNVAPHVVSEGLSEAGGTADPTDPNSLFLYLVQHEFLQSFREAERAVTYSLEDEINEFTNLAEEDAEREAKFKALPNQIKYMFSRENQQSGVEPNNIFSSGHFTFDYNEVSKYFFHNQNIYKAEAFLGYKSSKGRLFLKAPLWGPLGAALQGASTAGKRVVCRLIRYNGAASIPFDERLNLPVYHEYFLLSMSGTPLPLLTETEVVTGFQNAAASAGSSILDTSVVSIACGDTVGGGTY